MRKLPGETPWVEFKANNSNPEEIGEYVSAMSNTAAVHDRGTAYVVWGIEDGSKDVVGTTFKPGQAKVGNEDLEPWLLRLLSPHLNFRLPRAGLRGQAPCRLGDTALAWAIGAVQG